MFYFQRKMNRCILSSKCGLVLPRQYDGYACSYCNIHSWGRCAHVHVSWINPRGQRARINKRGFSIRGKP